jgi:hypothetical protein
METIQVLDSGVFNYNSKSPFKILVMNKENYTQNRDHVEEMIEQEPPKTNHQEYIENPENVVVLVKEDTGNWWTNIPKATRIIIISVAVIVLLALIILIIYLLKNKKQTFLTIVDLNKDTIKWV